MNYGISIPNFGDYFDARAVAQLAKDAEDAGWDGIFFWDHIHGGEWMRAPMADPWMLLTACAMTTSRIKLGPMVTPLARRRPHVVARQSATLDHLSHGRLVLGVGLGYPPDAEFEAFGEDGDDRTRAKKLDEALDIITGLWSGDAFSYEGEHHSLKDVTFLPKPVQQPRIPIWCAAMLPSRAPLRRAVRYDGVVPLRMSDEGIPELLSAADVASLAAFAKSQRPDGAPFDIVVAGWTPDRRNSATSHPSAKQPAPPGGSKTPSPTATSAPASPSTASPPSAPASPKAPSVRGFLINTEFTENTESCGWPSRNLCALRVLCVGKERPLA